MSGFSFEEFIAESLELRKQNLDFVVVTLVSARGSVPQNVGARMLVTAKGLHDGTVGGGKLENAALQKAREILLRSADSIKGAGELVTWNLQTDLKMSCGGEVQLYFEAVREKASWQIVVFGAGHVSQALVPLLLQLDCQVQVLDSRPDWLGRFEAHPRLIVSEEEGTQAAKKISGASFVVVMTMGHTTDLPILRELIGREEEFAFIGVMGSQIKGQKIHRELLELGGKAERVDKIHCPLGEKWGDNSPIEIALSVVAQLIRVRDEVQNSGSL